MTIRKNPVFVNMRIDVNKLNFEVSKVQAAILSSTSIHFLKALLGINLILLKLLFRTGQVAPLHFGIVKNSNDKQKLGVWFAYCKANRLDVFNVKQSYEAAELHGQYDQVDYDYHNTGLHEFIANEHYDIANHYLLCARHYGFEIDLNVTDKEEKMPLMLAIMMGAPID